MAETKELTSAEIIDVVNNIYEAIVVDGNYDVTVKRVGRDKLSTISPLRVEHRLLLTLLNRETKRSMVRKLISGLFDEDGKVTAIAENISIHNGCGGFCDIEFDPQGQIIDVQYRDSDDTSVKDNGKIWKLMQKPLRLWDEYAKA